MSTDDDERAPLNGSRDWREDGGGEGAAPIAARDGDRRDSGRDQDVERGEEGGCDDDCDDRDDDAGFATYERQFRMGRYGGYCALGRASSHHPRDRVDDSGTNAANDDDHPADDDGDEED